MTSPAIVQRGQPETIFAPASGVGRAAVAVIRISGPRSELVLRELGRGLLPPPRRASLRRLTDPASGEVLDEALVLWMPGPGTFTGEDQAELQIHGSPAVRTSLLRVLSGMPGCRAAEPGEFTRRAFLNGRLDLTAVEGLADLIEAETEAQRRQALRQLDGHLARQVEAWREGLVDALATCEAALDFADEDDVPADIAFGAAAAMAGVRAEITGALDSALKGETVREGFQVVIAGPPNAGKSTLLNALARRDLAIVSPIPGTTRDVIEVRCDIGGLPVTFADTAGIRESQDAIEQEGIGRAQSRMEGADLVLWLEPANAGLPPPPPYGRSPSPSGRGDSDGARASPPPTQVGPARLGHPEGTNSATAGFAGEGDHAQHGGGGSPRDGMCRAPIIRIGTKSDLGRSAHPTDLEVSAKTGAGIAALLDRIQTIAASALEPGADAVLTRERHRAILTRVAECLDRVALAGQGSSEARIELVAEDIRLALRHLGRMTGAVDVEEVLDRIFASFCIGK